MSEVIAFPIERAAPPRPSEATGLVLMMPAPRHYSPAANFGFTDSATFICYQDGDYYVVDLPPFPM